VKRGGGGAEPTISPKLATQVQVQGQNENVYYEMDPRHMGGAELQGNLPVGVGRAELSS
jgi:hypothetical protein